MRLHYDVKTFDLGSVHLSSRRRPSPGLPPPHGLAPAADLLVHLAGDPAEEGQAVQQSGGVCHHGDADRSRADELQADGAAPPGPQGEGETTPSGAIS